MPELDCLPLKAEDSESIGRSSALSVLAMYPGYRRTPLVLTKDKGPGVVSLILRDYRTTFLFGPKEIEAYSITRSLIVSIEKTFLVTIEWRKLPGVGTFAS